MAGVSEAKSMLFGQGTSNAMLRYARELLEAGETAVAGVVEKRLGAAAAARAQTPASTTKRWQKQLRAGSAAK